MKNTRKKMLLSSVAMLLVALVALGSATFAWYITNATVTAETTNFSAAAAEGLVIRHKSTEEWTNKITDLETKENMSPATINYSDAYANITGGTGQGTAFDNGTLSGDLTKEEVTNESSAFLVDTFYVASSSASSVEATMKVEATTVAGTYMNLAIYVGGKLQTVLTSADSYTDTGKITSDKNAVSVTQQPNGQELVAMNNNVIKNVDNSDKGTFTCTPKTGNGLEVDIVAFADGYNPLCKNSTANFSNVSVKYTFTASGD